MHEPVWPGRRVARSRRVWTRLLARGFRSPRQRFMALVVAAGLAAAGALCIWHVVRHHPPPFPKPKLIERQGRESVRLYPSLRPRSAGATPSFDVPAHLDSDVSDDTLVALVTNRGETKAYPLRWLDALEIARDTIGGQHFLITYCGMTYSPAVYTSTEALDCWKFYDSGYLNEANLVLRDSTTGSLWRQLTGECITGASAGHVLAEQEYTLAHLGAATAAIRNLTARQKSRPGE